MSENKQAKTPTDDGHVAHVYLFEKTGRPMVAWDNAKDIKLGDRLYVAPKHDYVIDCPRCGHCCKSDLARVGEVGVWGECEPQEALEDGWCDWVCPKPQGYLMQCCDCELIHEVDFRVVQYEPKPSEVYEVVDDPNLQAQMRLRRRDDLSPKREWVALTDEEIHDLIYVSQKIDASNSPWFDCLGFYRAVEEKLKERNI